ncbi:MAG: class I SAM-dependent methyltransferase [Vicinamibacteria bacterium]
MSGGEPPRLDSRARFSETADLYERYRPSYPPELLDWIVAQCGLRPADPVADLGCGTGISTRLLAARGLDVVGIDPNEAMLERARAAGGARYLRGEANATGLPTGSQAAVSVAQAFHWFDVPAALREIGRVLRPGGRSCVYWNLHGRSPFLAEYDALLMASSSEAGVMQRPLRTIAALRAAPPVREAREAEFAYSQSFDREGIFGRAFSSSYVQHGLADRAGFERALGGLFDRHQRDGSVDFVYRTVAIGFTLAL